MSEPTDNVLAYQHDADANEHRGRRMLPHYLIGMLLTLFIWTVLPSFSFGEYAFQRYFMKAIPEAALSAAIALFPAVFGFSFAVWLRQRQDRHHYAGLYANLLCGALTAVVASFLPIPFLVPFTLTASLAAGWCLCSHAKENDNEGLSLRKLYRRRWVVAAVSMVALASLALLSHASSIRTCEQRMAREIAIHYMRGDPFKVRGRFSDGMRIFREGGFKASGPILAHDPDPFPWADVGDAKLEGPFMVSVGWDWCVEPLYGGGGRKRYLAIFGLLIELPERQMHHY